MKIKIWNYITDFDDGIECVAYPTAMGPLGETTPDILSWCATAMIAAGTATPFPAKIERPKVVVEVSGGVAEVTQCPDGVEVEIIDYDDLEDQAEQARIAERGISFGGKGGAS